MSMPRLKMSIFLTQSDVAILTGHKTKICQVRALRNMGIPFFVNPAGRPIVTRAAVEGGKAETQQPEKWTPPNLMLKRSSGARPA
jgi:hypothetical protein